MNNNMSLETLKGHLFETLEGLKNLSDSNASECEKVSIDQAKQIVDVSEAILDIYKVQLDAVKSFVHKDDIFNSAVMLNDMGVVEEQNIKLLK